MTIESVVVKTIETEEEINLGIIAFSREILERSGFQICARPYDGKHYRMRMKIIEDGDGVAYIFQQTPSSLGNYEFSKKIRFIVGIIEEERAKENETR